MHGIGLSAFLVTYLLILIPVWRIVSKAGYSGAWSLIMFVPLINLIMIWVFAFSRWPVEAPAAK
jgi:hypothetical protein